MSYNPFLFLPVTARLLVFKFNTHLGVRVVVDGNRIFKNTTRLAVIQNSVRLVSKF